jgi:hypothetical protein
MKKRIIELPNNIFVTIEDKKYHFTYNIIFMKGVNEFLVEATFTNVSNGSVKKYGFLDFIPEDLVIVGKTEIYILQPITKEKFIQTSLYTHTITKLLTDRIYD